MVADADIETAVRISQRFCNADGLSDAMGSIYIDGRPFPDIKQFIEDDYYFGKVAKSLWPDNVPDILDIFDPRKSYTEVILSGATSVGKTFLACISMCYMMGKLLHYKNPHKWVGASPTSPIVFINMSINARKAKEVVFTRVKNMIDSSPYFREQMPRDYKLTDSLVWRRGDTAASKHNPIIILKPGTGDSLSALGDDIFGGAGDELNFFRIIEKSKKTRGEYYDPAQRLYDTISRRIKGRFSTGGQALGKFFLLSSAQYPDDFIERRIEEARSDGSLGITIKVIKKSTWQARRGVFINDVPVFGDRSFRVEVGTTNTNSRILDKYNKATDEIVPSVDETTVKGKVIVPPLELYDEFDRDIDGSIRDFGGEVTRAIKPFFPNTGLVWEAAEYGELVGLSHPWSQEETTLQDGSFVHFDKLFTKVEQGKDMNKTKLIRHPGAPRYWHADLGLTNDPAGLCISHVSEWKQTISTSGSVENKPVIETDFILRIVPPTGGKITYADIRSILILLRNSGMWLKHGTFDQYQSEDSIQILNSVGIPCKKGPDDITQFLTLRDTIQEHRLCMYRYTPLIYELCQLEEQRGKVDHPPGGHNDLAVALARSVFNTVMGELVADPGMVDARLPSQAIKQRAPTQIEIQKSAEEEMRDFMKGRRFIRKTN